MHRKFNDDIFARCLVIMKNVVISYIKEYRGPTLRPPCDVIDEVVIMKIPRKDGLYIETGPWTFWHHMTCGDDACLYYCKDFSDEICTH